MLSSFRNTLPDLKSYVRILNAAAGGGSYDIYANGNLIAKNIAFSKISDYVKLEPGSYDIEIFDTGTYDTPLSSEKIEVLPKSSFTICIIIQESALLTLKLKDAARNYTPPMTNLRFINLSPNAPLLSLSLANGDTLFNGVEYLENTKYYSLSSGIYNFLLTATNDSSFRKFINNLDLSVDNFHTIYIIGLVDDTPKLGYLFTKDGV